jgi:hypothetical protein
MSTPTDKTFTAYARIAVSFLSSAQACAYAEAEMPFYSKEEHFEKYLGEANGEWNKALGNVAVDTTGVDSDVVINFWSSVGCLTDLMPRETLISVRIFSYIVPTLPLLTSQGIIRSGIRRSRTMIL